MQVERKWGGRKGIFFGGPAVAVIRYGWRWAKSLGHRARAVALVLFWCGHWT